jgi:hypothetical protein
LYVALNTPLTLTALLALKVTVAFETVTPEPATVVGAIATSPLFAKYVFVSDAVSSSPVVNVFIAISTPVY